MTLTRIDVFGGLRASVDGSPLPPVNTRPGAFLALLVLARGHPVNAGEIVDWLWGEEAVPSATNQLQRLVGQLRRQFDPHLEARSPGRVILGANDGYRLADTVGSDLFDVDELLADPSQVAQHAASVLRLVRKPPFAGLERILAEHPSYVAVERQCAGIAIDALDLAATDDPDRDIVDLVQAVAARFPFEERLQAGLIRALGSVGRRSEALALYDRVRLTLRDELGVDPGPDLDAAHRHVLDLDRPVRAATPAGPAQLPRVVGGLVARPGAQRQLDRVAASGDAGTVLVTAIGGMGGIGKTTLAVAWAHQLAPRFPDGQLYLNLRGFDALGDVMPPHEAVAALLTAIGATSAGTDPGLDAQSALLRSCLAGRRYLLLLDNARDAEQVRPLLPGDPGCLAIITSRNRLTSLVTHEGAVPIHLDRMDDAEAEELLTRRLGSDLVRADPVATVAVVRACDGLPLALALIATRIAIEPRLTLTDIARELRGTDVTAWSAEVGSEDLRAVFDWSLAVLDDREVEAFHLIGAHPAQRMSMASLVSLLGEEPESCARTVRGLCDASLVQQLDRHHFGMHDLLRGYAQAMPDTSGRVRDAEMRLVNHVVHASRNADDTDARTHSRPAGTIVPGVVPETFALEVDIRAWYLDEREAIDAVVALAVRNGWLRDAANIVMNTRTAAHSYRMSRQRSFLLFDILVAANGLESDDAFGDQALLGDVLRAVGANRGAGGENDQAEQFFRRAERLLDEAGDRVALCQLLRVVGRMHAARGDFDLAEASYKRGLALAAQEKAATVEALIHIELGNTYFETGDWEAAIESNGRAIAVESTRRSVGLVIITAHINRAENMLRMDRVDEALLEVAAIRAAGGEEYEDNTLLAHLEARAAFRAGDHELARRAVGEFRRLAAERTEEDFRLMWIGGLPALLTDIDEIDRALTG
jgi:DNA-binding SARP family transcriptional activator/tetratricopeptide (TPR) repeat protein